MSVEVITTVISTAMLLLSFGAFVWLVDRKDVGDSRLETRLESVGEKLRGHIDAVAGELVEVHGRHRATRRPP